MTPRDLGNRVCTRCGIMKLIRDFGIDRSKKDGRRPSCRDCKSYTDRTYREANKQVISKKKKEYRDAYEQAINAKGRIYYREIRERYAEYKKSC